MDLLEMTFLIFFNVDQVSPCDRYCFVIPLAMVMEKQFH